MIKNRSYWRTWGVVPTWGVVSPSAPLTRQQQDELNRHQVDEREHDRYGAELQRLSYFYQLGVCVNAISAGTYFLCKLKLGSTEDVIILRQGRGTPSLNLRDLVPDARILIVPLGSVTPMLALISKL